MADWVEIGLGLGGNLGDSARMIADALALLRARGHVRIARTSSLYRTAPWGPIAQPDFINCCALGSTDLAPGRLLAEVKIVEAALGRECGERWGPRVVDVDILFFGQNRVTAPGLVIPHESLFQRAFVLVPLAEIAPDLAIGGRRVGQAAAACDRSSVVRCGDAPP